jgi:DNA-binding NarL/FixJ family response regulator
VEEADDMHAALVLARRSHFDLLLIDLTVCGGDGADLIREIKGAYSPDQVVVITAVPELTTIKGLLDLGAVTLLPKPLSVEALVACVERIAGVQLPLTMEADDERT